MRKRIFEIIELSDGEDRISAIYDYFMMVTIFISIIPLAFKQDLLVFHIVDKIAMIIFIIDYISRLVTSDYKYDRKSILSFVRYPFSFMAIIDLLSILPSISLLNSGFKLFKLFRLFRTFRVFRVFKVMRYSKSIQIIIQVLKNTKENFIAVGILAVAYILISSLVVFNVEPDTFKTFFDAVYWSTVSLTTVGYGDIYPVSTIGRVVTMISSIFGVAIIALPAGIITAGYMEEIKKDK